MILVNKYFIVLFLSVISLIAWLLYTTQMEKVCDSVKWEIDWSTGERELDREKGGENIPVPEGKRKKESCMANTC